MLVYQRVTSGLGEDSYWCQGSKLTRFPGESICPHLPAHDRSSHAAREFAAIQVGRFCGNVVKVKSNRIHWSTIPKITINGWYKPSIYIGDLLLLYSHLVELSDWARATCQCVRKCAIVPQNILKSFSSGDGPTTSTLQYNMNGDQIVIWQMFSREMRMR